MMVHTVHDTDFVYITVDVYMAMKSDCFIINM